MGSLDNIFNQAIENVLKNEGGYVNDPYDPGGETIFGISKRIYPHLDIKNITRNQAIDIYKKLSLNRANRHCEATAFLDDHYNEYIKLVNGSNVREEYINDYLIEIKITEPEEIVQETVPTHSFPNY
jgi:hypothetical protein